MARAYSGVLGSIAMCLVIARGLATGLLPNEILIQSLVVFFTFGLIGCWIGYIAETTVAESVEIRFRSEMARLHSAAANSNSETSED
jgi:predicted DNA-binding transcriptional regulator